MMGTKSAWVSSGQCSAQEGMLCIEQTAGGHWDSALFMGSRSSLVAVASAPRALLQAV